MNRRDEHTPSQGMQSIFKRSCGGQEVVEHQPPMQVTWEFYPGTRRSPGEGNGNSIQYSCLENPMDRGAWRAPVHGIAKSRTQLSMSTRSNPSQGWPIPLEVFCKMEDPNIFTSPLPFPLICLLTLVPHCFLSDL